MNHKLFRKSSLDRVTGPEQLDDYIRVAGPSLWILLGAILLLLVSVIVWSVTGSLPTTLSLTGLGDGKGVTCYVSPEMAAGLAPGMEARAGDAQGTVESVGDIPLSREEAAKRISSDYLRESLGLGDWNVPVTLAVSPAPQGLCLVSITVESIRPIRFILN